LYFFLGKQAGPGECLCVKTGFIVHVGSSPHQPPCPSSTPLSPPHLIFASAPPQKKGERAHHTPHTPMISPEKACTSHSTTQTCNHTHRRLLELPVNPPTSLFLNEVNFTPYTRPHSHTRLPVSLKPELATRTPSSTLAHPPLTVFTARASHALPRGGAFRDVAALQCAPSRPAPA
jgi:hypothetical protein